LFFFPHAHQKPPPQKEDEVPLRTITSGLLRNS